MSAAAPLALAAVIPCHNDAATLAPLLGALARLGPVAEVVVIDDASSPPLCSTALLHDAGAEARAMPPGWLRILRNSFPVGAGAARNLGLTLVTAPHVIFLDADDMALPDLAHLMRDLAHDPAGHCADFCIFQHHDTRGDQERLWGQRPFDDRLWRQAGLSHGALNPVSETQAALLAQTANYPWNKIYRTAFLRDKGIGCTPLMVHNDVELHWRSFLLADRILASDRIGVVHVVRPSGNRLTNRHTAERLRLFPVLDALATEIALGARPALAEAFNTFVWGLADWIQAHLPPADRPALRACASRFWLDHTSPALRENLRARRGPLLERLGIG
ncbi:glycosyltransferase family 2 protein [Paracoccus bogoriensis]|uniref:glycosyltransferase family 2 protein n=1 Tax=Paracoccus bogoriensis TaxID=242065 RepID=UPI001C675779|nr:glycosyltransferase family 2 protein [Paracoccus bogoriensis]MBW7056848.1 glycosyltransferase family 2 protein [Paracoccus bogoriensis]